jgi:hypothetical protein
MKRGVATDRPRPRPRSCPFEGEDEDEGEGRFMERKEIEAAPQTDPQVLTVPCVGSEVDGGSGALWESCSQEFHETCPSIPVVSAQIMTHARQHLIVARQLQLLEPREEQAMAGECHVLVTYDQQ